MRKIIKKLVCKILGHKPFVYGGSADGKVCKRCGKRLDWCRVI